MARMSSTPNARRTRDLIPRDGEALVTIRFELEGEVEASRTLMALQARLDDWTPALPEVDRVLRAAIARQFATEGEAGGEKWAPLKPATQAARRRAGYGAAHPILRRTNALYSSLTSVTGDTISLHHPTRYAIGTAVPYFRFHQSIAARRFLPRRPAIQLTEADKQAALRPIRRWYTGHDPSGAVRGVPQSEPVMPRSGLGWNQ